MLQEIKSVDYTSELMENNWEEVEFSDSLEQTLPQLHLDKTWSSSGLWKLA